MRGLGDVCALLGSNVPTLRGKVWLNSMGYIDRCKPSVGKFAFFTLPTGSAMSCESSVLIIFYNLSYPYRNRLTNWRTRSQAECLILPRGSESARQPLQGDLWYLTGLRRAAVGNDQQISFYYCLCWIGQIFLSQHSVYVKWFLNVC